MKPFIAALILLLTVSGCAHVDSQQSIAAKKSPGSAIAPFSENLPKGLPHDWVPLVLFRDKKQTQYNLADVQGKTVLHALAVEASSGLMQYVKIDPLQQPWIEWRWKIASIVEEAGKNSHVTEDSPARIVLGFDGDKDTLSFSDQILFETAKMFTGYDFPYATLMYVWDSRMPIGSVVSSRRSGRIKMIVVANSVEDSAKWQSFDRNVVADFEKAFGEKPGMLIGVGVLTDSDHSGGRAEAWYGDIRMQSAAEHDAGRISDNAPAH